MKSYKPGVALAYMLPYLPTVAKLLSINYCEIFLLFSLVTGHLRIEGIRHITNLYYGLF